MTSAGLWDYSESDNVQVPGHHAHELTDIKHIPQKACQACLCGQTPMQSTICMASIASWR